MLASIVEQAIQSPVRITVPFNIRYASCILFIAAALAGCATTPPVNVSAAEKAPTSPATPVYQLAQINGATPTHLDALLGAPALSRREGPGEFRRYTLTDCALIVILYPDETGIVRAAHVDTAALKTDTAKPDLDACLAAG